MYSIPNVSIINQDNLVPAGEYTVISEISDPIRFFVTYPISIAWSLDWEGWGVTDTVLNELTRLSQNHAMPYTHFINPRQFITDEIPPDQQTAMTSWTLDRITQYGDEAAMHIHAQYDFATYADVTPKTKPAWGYKNSTGYDVYLTAFSPDEIQAFIHTGLTLFEEHGLPRPVGFRSGGWFSDPQILHILSANNFLYDSSGRTHEMWNGEVLSSWKLSPSTQLYYPSKSDINSNTPPHIDIAEFPNTAGNTYEFDAETLMKPVLDILESKVQYETVYFVFMSHPQFADKELDIADAVLSAFDAHTIRLDKGPIIYRTIKDMYDIWKK